jgi:hypothetical protein
MNAVIKGAKAVAKAKDNPKSQTIQPLQKPMHVYSMA